MVIKKEGKLRFTFPAGWRVTKYDEWSFHKQFQNICAGAKAVDFIAVQPDSRITWLIEVKDFRQHRRTKPSELSMEIACKYRDTLAGLACARIHSNDDSEQELANLSLQTDDIRLVLHLEQPQRHSKLFPRAFEPADIKHKLRMLVKAMDPHPLVLDMHKQEVAWQVTGI